MRSGDVEDLGHFCAEVYNALSILQAIGYSAELDSYRTLSSLVEKLPMEGQLGWGSFARAHVEDGRTLTCQMFYDFINSHLKDRQFGVTKYRSSDKSIRQRSYATIEEATKNKHRRQGQIATKETGQKLSCFY